MRRIVQASTLFALECGKQLMYPRTIVHVTQPPPLPAPFARYALYTCQGRRGIFRA